MGCRNDSDLGLHLSAAGWPLLAIKQAAYQRGSHSLTAAGPPQPTTQYILRDHVCPTFSVARLHNRAGAAEAVGSNWP